jgi:hypothetical protein
VQVSEDNSSNSLLSREETTSADQGGGLEPAALHGLAGDVVRALEPFTEADPAALLGTLLASVGNAVGSASHATAGARAHPAQLYVVLVGETSRARKGTAQATVDQVMAQASPEWFEDHRAGGLASGEGIIAAIHRLDDSGAEVDPETSAIKRVTFQGDLRLQVVEPEFARVLRAASREGSTLSAVLRQAWDGDALAVLTRKDPLRSPPAHLSIAAHVTVEELRATLNDVEAANGFANRFLFVLVRRSKLLPHGGNPPDDLVLELGNRVGAAIDRARKTVGAMTRTLEADAIWERAYRGWAENAPPGLVGALTARPEAQTLRLSVAYALLDGSSAIDVPHLEAALGFWRYCERSTETIFGSATGDQLADKLLEYLRRAGDAGLTSDQQHAHFGRHVSARRLDHARNLLKQHGLATITPEETGGRPRIVTRATKQRR